MTTLVTATVTHTTPAAGRSNDRPALEAAAQDFEAVFLAQVLRSLAAGLRGEGPLGGSEADPFQDLLADAYARLIARAGGIGIADAVMRELVRAQETP
jgi:Rod binding domain-containing protein